MKDYEIIFHTPAGNDSVVMQAKSHSVKDGILSLYDDNNCLATFLHWSYVRDITVPNGN